MKRVFDQFQRTPLRRYDLPPREEPRIKDIGRFRKRHFDVPVSNAQMGIRIGGLTVVILMVLLLCNASSPMNEVPDVNTRFQEWAKIQNEKTLQVLPGDTPEPDSEIAQVINFTQEEQKQTIEQTIEESISQQGQSVVNQTITTDGFKHYEPGDLVYDTDRMHVSIEQKKKDGITYFACDIRITDPSQLRTAFAGDDFKSGIYETVSDISDRYSPVLAINADFCRYHRNGVIIRNGELLRKQNITRHHLMIVDQEGRMTALTDRSGKQGVVAEELKKKNTWQTFEFGPVLVSNGEAATLPKTFYINCHDGYYEPRTAVGMYEPLHYLVIVVDGRREGYSTGASIPQLQKIFLDEGVNFAFNLDGGGSTTLYFLGNVINMPSGGKQRSVSDVLMFMANPM